MELKIEGFRRTAGGPAADLLQKLQNRHQQCSFSTHPSKAISITWEETWSSDKAGTRDQNGETMIHHLGQLLRDSNQKFSDPFFPAEVSGLFVDPSQADKNRAAATTARFDEDAFLAGKDIARDVSWKRVAEIGNPKETPVVQELEFPCVCFHFTRQFTILPKPSTEFLHALPAGVQRHGQPRRRPARTARKLL
jgi:hypothetical protein